MSHRDTGRDQILHELTTCQRRVNELEKLENKQEVDLLQAKAAFETVFEFAPDALVVVDRRGRITRINSQAEKLFGYRREELIGEDHGVLVPERTKDRHAALMEGYMDKPRLRTMGIGLELYGRRKDGTVFPVDIDLGPLETADGLFVLGVVRDVTPRKKLEEDLSTSEKRYRELVELSPDAIVVHNGDKIVFVNAAGAGLLGVAPTEQLVGKPLMGFVHPDHLERVKEEVRQVLQERKIAPPMEVKFLRQDGSVAYGEVASMPVIFQERPGILSIVRDITERKKLEEELSSYRQRLEEVVAERTAEFARANAKLTQTMEEHRKSEEGLMLRAAILDNAGVPIFVFNQKFDFVYANDAACQTYGYSRDEFLAMNLRHLLPPEDASLVESRLEEVMRTGKLELDTVHVRKDRSPMPVQTRHTRIKTLHGHFIVSVMHEIRSE